MFSAKLLDVLCLINKENFLGAVHQYEAAARQNLVRALARNSEVYNKNAQIRQLEQEADTRFSQRQRELLSRFPYEANQALEDEVTSEIWRRDDRLYDLRTELILLALHAEHVSQQPSQEDVGLYIST